MTPKFLVVALALTSGTAVAAPRGEVMADLAPNLATQADRALYAALQQEHADLQRVRSWTLQFRDAERDLRDASVERSVAQVNRDAAVRAGHVFAAGVWAPRYSQALRDESDAFARVLHVRIARDLARADLARSEAAVRHADTRAQREARG